MSIIYRKCVCLAVVEKPSPHTRTFCWQQFFSRLVSRIIRGFLPFEQCCCDGRQTKKKKKLRFWWEKGKVFDVWFHEGKEHTLIFHKPSLLKKKETNKEEYKHTHTHLNQQDRITTPLKDPQLFPL